MGVSVVGRKGAERAERGRDGMGRIVPEGISNLLYAAPESIVIHNTLIRYRTCTNPLLALCDQTLHDSGCVFERMGTAADVLAFLHKITQEEDACERQLAQLMLDFASKGAYITDTQLRLLNAELGAQDVTYLNQVLYFYMVKRVVRWCVSVGPEAAPLALPLASVQARALQLIRCGVITFQEAFSMDGMFGVFYRGGYESCLHGNRDRVGAGGAGAGM
ncbi:hypothetical protein B484DRAFT_392442, partial [Ochromonadaceae sp. CCMP2298]